MSGMRFAGSVRLCDCSVGCRWPWGTHGTHRAVGTGYMRPLSESPTCRVCGYQMCSCPPRRPNVEQRKGWHPNTWNGGCLHGFERDAQDGAVWADGARWRCGPRTGDTSGGTNRLYKSDVGWGTRGLGSAAEAMDWVEAHLPAEGTRTFKMPERMYTATELVNLKMPLAEKHELVRRYEASGAISPGQAAYIINGDWHR